ncbi:hypothetical protein CRD60_05160 [Bifidobacterium aemilianum]|uniref:DUF4160 domain-containing protein n=1 Tax=Bifidobacterium aemilianum TaxID=2493120 RepID=A0A366K7J4_9BIFI|nr:hypothetical protein CRD60_05160 [Bifidobacterium aemilianum]
MPEVFVLDGYAVYFSALDRNHGVHVHVRKGKQLDLARFTISSDRTVELAHNHGRLSQSTINYLQTTIADTIEEVLSLWVVFSDLSITSTSNFMHGS